MKLLVMQFSPASCHLPKAISELVSYWSVYLSVIQTEIFLEDF